MSNARSSLATNLGWLFAAQLRCYDAGPIWNGGLRVITCPSPQFSTTLICSGCNANW
jgi:hypothetical protein